MLLSIYFILTTTNRVHCGISLKRLWKWCKWQKILSGAFEVKQIEMEVQEKNVLNLNMYYLGKLNQILYFCYQLD